MKKFVVGGILVLVLAVVAASVFFLSNLNSIVAKVIEDEGSKVASADVRVSGVEISLREGRGTLAGLSIGNPEGFQAEYAFELGEVTLDIDLGSVREDPLVIDEINVKGPVVHAELQKDGSMNLNVLKKNVQAYAPAQQGGDQKDSGEAKKVRIKTFVFEKGRIEVDASALGAEPQSLDLPPIRLNDVGGADGAGPDQIAQVILKELTARAAAAVAKSGLQKALEDEAKDQAKGLLDKITQ